MKLPLYTAVAIIAATGCAGTRTKAKEAVQANLSIPVAAIAKPSFQPAVSKKMQAGELPPDRAAQACNKTAEELEKRGFDIEAVAHYERARQLVPSTADIAWRLAMAQDRLGNEKAAAEEFAKALAIAPNNADLLNDAGYFFTAWGDLKTAEKHLKEAIRIRADHANAWANLGTLYAKSNRLPEAETAFGKVMAPAQVSYNLGVVLAGQGQAIPAKKRFQYALALDPEFAAAKEALANIPASSSIVQ